MSNKEQELLDQILEETDGRRSQPEPSAEPAADQQGEAVAHSTTAEDSNPEEAAEQAASPAADSSSGQQQTTSAQHAEATDLQPESGDGATTAAAMQTDTDSGSQATAPAAQEAVQTAQKKAKQSANTAAQGAPKKRRKKIVRKKFAFVDVLRGLFPWKGDSILEGTRKVVFLVSVVGFSVCLNLVGSYYLERYQSKKLYDDINKIISDIEIPEPKVTTAAEGSVTEYLDLNEIGEKLLAINPDAVGYISIPGTKVNYPVVQRKNAEDGNIYYLHRSFNLEDNDNGTIFLDYRCYLDDAVDGVRTYANSTNLVIYGHNMGDTSMFGSLKFYRNDYGYYEKHPLIVLNSCYETYTYKIFGFFICDGVDESETKFEYWNTLNYQSEDEFYDYVNKVKRRTIRNTNVDVKYGDQLLTLSTCHGSFKDAKLVVMARMVRPGEDPYEGTTGSELNNNVLWPTVYYQWNRNTYDPDAPFTPYGPAAETTGSTTETTLPADTKKEEDSTE